jgi:hypothetical protein
MNSCHAAWVHDRGVATRRNLANGRRVQAPVQWMSCQARRCGSLAPGWGDPSQDPHGPPPSPHHTSTSATAVVLFCTTSMRGWSENQGFFVSREQDWARHMEIPRRRWHPWSSSYRPVGRQGQSGRQHRPLKNWGPNSSAKQFLLFLFLQHARVMYFSHCWCC